VTTSNSFQSKHEKGVGRPFPHVPTRSRTTTPLPLW